MARVDVSGVAAAPDQRLLLAGLQVEYGDLRVVDRLALHDDREEDARPPAG